MFWTPAKYLKWYDEKKQTLKVVDKIISWNLTSVLTSYGKKNSSFAEWNEFGSLRLFRIGGILFGGFAVDGRHLQSKPGREKHWKETRLRWASDITSYFKNCAITKATSFPGSSLFLPRESTLVSAGHVSPLSKQLPRVDSLFFKKRREKRMQIFSTGTKTEEWKSSAHFFFKDRDAEKIYSLLSAAFQKHK